MATHDYNIANQIAVNLREDINDALEAIVSTNSNATAPTTTYAHMWWYDTANDLLKMRDESNSAWITIGYVDQSNLNFQPYIGGTQVTEVLDEDDMASNSDTGVPTQQSVKSYVDALDTTVDGVDVKNRYLAYRNGGTGWATFTGLLDGVKSFTLMYKTSSDTGTIYIQTSSDGGSSWSSDKTVGNAGGSRVFVDLDTGRSFEGSYGFESHSFGSGVDSVRVSTSLGPNAIEAALMVEEGWDT